MTMEPKARSRKASLPVSPPLTPQKPTGRLPPNFAASFEYQAECIVDLSHLPTRNTSEPSSFRLVTPRRSPRAKQTRITDLSAAYSEEDEDDAHDIGTSISPSKRRKDKVSQADTSEDEATKTSRSPKRVKTRKRIKRTRDDPNSAAGSIYAHLKGLPDLFAEHNDIMFCGINPGVKSSSSGHHFAHRSNHFYPSLHLAGITAQRMKPEQDVEFPFLRPFSLGLTNLAPRPTAEGSELLPSELIDGVPILIEKIQRWKPRTVCFVGKGISEAFVKGLKHAGAIDNASASKKSRRPATASASLSNVKLEPRVKLEDAEASLASTSRREATIQPMHRSLQVHIPADVLCVHTTVAKESKDVKPSKVASPTKPTKQLYTKGNSKDDVGYGMLPICVPHSSSIDGGGLTLDQVTLLFVTPSSSARVTTHFLDDKARILTGLRRLVEHLQATTNASVAPSSGHSEDNKQTYDRLENDLKLEGDRTVASGSGVLPSAPQLTQTIDLEVVDASRYSLTAAKP